ncbi:MAG TPA: hypothetical protein VK437_07150, partial [Steroidobacteraceae bacterium]|nr:hypothetical protein [Steroidobacteraceae bacterium]
QWMRILRRVPGSVLFLLASSSSVERNLRAEAQARGVDPARLIFGGRLAAPEYLARYRVAGLFLDTLPYNAGTTASDALWSGLPVLTRAGEAFASRMAASLLTALEMPELVADTDDRYVDMAVELAESPERLSEIRARLAHKRRTVPLFDTRLFTQRLEAAFIEIHSRRLAGLEPDDLRVGFDRGGRA